MNCKKAGEAMLLYMDKKIRPSKAAALARHVLKCEDCREYFMAFDIAMESMEGATYDAAVLTEAPEGFTASVMAKVRHLPAYTPLAVVSKADIAVRIFWGICAVFLGIGLSVMYNQDAIASFIATHPQFAAVANVANAIGGFFNGFIEQIVLFTGAPSGGSVAQAIPGIEYTALAFVALLAVSLFVVLRGEKSNA